MNAARSAGGPQATLLARRRELIRRAEAQRDELGMALDQVRGTFLGAERAFRVVGALQTRAPQLAVAAAVASLLLGPTRVWSWATGAWQVWNTVRGLIASRRSKQGFRS